MYCSRTLWDSCVRVPLKRTAILRVPKPPAGQPPRAAKNGFQEAKKDFQDAQKEPQDAQNDSLRRPTGPPRRQM